MQEGPAAEQKKADVIAQAKADGLSFSCAADVKLFMERIAAQTLSGQLPATAAQPLNSICRTLLATFFAGEDDLSAVPDAIKALTTAELYEQMARALPTPVLRKELAAR